MSSSKKFTFKGLCGKCLTLSEFIDWIYSQSCWYFRPSFVNCCLSNLLSGSNLPPPPQHVSNYSIYRQCVVRGCWVLLETIFCRSLTLCIWPDSEPTKLLHHPKQKPSGGGGPQTDKHLPQSPLQINCFRWQHFALVSVKLISPWPRIKTYRMSRLLLPYDLIPLLSHPR